MSALVRIDFTGCVSSAVFKVTANLSANNGAARTTGIAERSAGLHAAPNVSFNVNFADLGARLGRAWRSVGVSNVLKTADKSTHALRRTWMPQSLRH
jgi:hypothetical protein